MSSFFSPDQCALLARRYLETTWNAQVVEDLSATSAHAPGFPPTETETTDLALSLVQLRQAICAAFSDRHFTITELLVSGERVMVRWQMQGTDLGGYENHLPSGKTISLTGVSMLRLEQHTLVEEWNEVDVAGMLRQLGFVYVPQPPRITLKRPGSTRRSEE